MNNKEIYESLDKLEGLKLYSYMGIIPRNSNHFDISSEDIEKRLTGNKEFTIISFDADTLQKGANSNEFDHSITIKYQKNEYTIQIYTCSTEGLNLSSFSFANTVDKESIDTAHKQSFYLETKMLFDDDPMQSFLFQLKVLNTIMPDASLVIDFSSLRMLSPYWLKMTAESQIPPSPNYLYTVHAVYDEKEKGENLYWMHTHGLHRCGSVELELVNIKAGAKEMYNLINTAANLFIMEHRKEYEPFEIGYDGLGIRLCWIRWEDALSRFPKDTLGGIADRSLEDGEDYNIHAEPSGVLFAVEDGEYISPEIYINTLDNNPIFYISTEETLRMSALAKERFHLFKDTFDRFGPKEKKKSSFLNKIFTKKETETDWQFLVKLGLVTDNAKSEEEKEHLWFEVISIDNNDFLTGKLLNQPYWIAGLSENDIKTFPVYEVLTDWIIYGPEYNYTPDSIYQIDL